MQVNPLARVYKRNEHKDQGNHSGSKNLSGLKRTYHCGQKETQYTTYISIHTNTNRASGAKPRQYQRVARFKSDNKKKIRHKNNTKNQRTKHEERNHKKTGKKVGGLSLCPTQTPKPSHFTLSKPLQPLYIPYKHWELFVIRKEGLFVSHNKHYVKQKGNMRSSPPPLPYRYCG